MRLIKLLALIIFIILNNNRTYSQNKNRLQENPESIYRLDLVLPGIAVENGINSNLTILIKLGSGYSIYNSEENGMLETGIYFKPYFRIEPRRYINLEKRAFFGKRIDYYSGLYTGLQFSIGLANDQLETWQSFGPICGFQRTLWRRCYWNVELGIGAINFRGNLAFTLLGDLGIGIILNSRKNNH